MEGHFSQGKLIVEIVLRGTGSLEKTSVFGKIENTETGTAYQMQGVIMDSRRECTVLRLDVPEHSILFQ